jgi:hypothetical protein
MTRDPIVEEVREVRQRHAARFNYDAKAIFEDIKRKEQTSRCKIVSYPPKGPVRAKNV